MNGGLREENRRRDMEAAAEAGDVIAGQLALAGEDQGHGAFAAEFRDNVSLREPVSFEKKAKHVDGASIGNRVALRLILLDEKGEKLDGFFLIRREVVFRRQFEERLSVISQFFI